jgi:hypothetical protein
MFTIPKLTTAETKFVRTGEGVLVIGFNGAVIVATLVSHIISGVHGIPVTESMKWLGVLNSISVIGRSGLKAVLSASKIGLPEPAQLIDPAVLADAAAVAAQVGPQVTQDIKDPDANTIVGQAEADVTLATKPESAVTPDPGAPVPPATGGGASVA